MNRRFLFVAASAFLFSWNALAAEISPYSGQEAREIKALSEVEIDGLLAGRGLGYAKAAELNGYPGPRHVLELGDELGLSADQRALTESAFLRMQTQARELGAKLVEAERVLDEIFKNQTVTEDSLKESLVKIAQLNAQVREAHLQAHLVQTRILSLEQVAEYMRLRGYGEGGHGGHTHDHGGG
jgi:hypothetical protein